MDHKITRLRKLAYPVLFIGVLAASTASLFLRFDQQEAASIIIAAVRLVLATLFVVPFAIPKLKEEIKCLKGNEIGLIILAGVFLAIHFASWITSLEHTTVASSIVLVSTTPLWVAMFSGVLLGEKLNKWTWVGLVLTLLGGVIVAGSAECQLSASGFTFPNVGKLFTGTNAWGNLLALVGAWMVAGYLMVGRRLRPRLSLQSYVFMVYGSAALLLLTLAGIEGHSLLGYSKEIYLWLLLLAVIPQSIGHTSLNWALAYVPAAFVSVALLGEPVGTIILSSIFLRETPTILELMGGALILIGIYTASRMDHQADPQEG